MSIIAVLERGKRLSRGGNAVVAGEEHLGYGELIADVTSAARGLRARKIGTGAHVAVLSPNVPEALVATYAAMAAGAANVPLATTNGWQDVASSLDRFDCAALIYHSSLTDLVDQLRPHLAEDLLLIRIQSTDDTLDPSSTAAGDCTLRQLQATEPEGPLPSPALTDTAWLGSTGGTTGEPKGVMISWLAINSFLQKFAMEFPDPSPVTLLATPLTHAAGILALASFARGGGVVITRGLGKDFLPLIAQRQVTETFLPPTAIYKLLDDPHVREHDYGSLRTFLYGSAPMSLPRLREAIGVFGPVLTQAYGQTECHTLISVMKPADHFVDGDITGDLASDARLSACGWPTLGTIVEIRDDNGAVLPTGSIGQICVASDLAMTGYYKNPEETAMTLRDGFVLTGDIGHLDQDGCLHIVDRKKDLVITGGFNVYPAEIENLLRRRPGIADCAVVGIPDDYWGETVVAVVVPTSGTIIDIPALLADLRQECGPVKAPKHVLVTDHLPQTAIGKILKNDVRKYARQAIAARTP